METLNNYDYHQDLAMIYEAFVNQNETVLEELQQRLQLLLTHTEEDLNVKEYMQVMHMEGKKYHQQGNTNAARYCGLRLLQIEECLQGKRKAPRFLEMIEYQVPETMQSFIDEYTSFLKDTYSYIMKRLCMITLVLMVIVMVGFTVFFQMSIVYAVLNGMLVGALNFFLQKRRLPEMFQNNQLDASKKFVEADVLEFDRPIRYA